MALLQVAQSQVESLATASSILKEKACCSLTDTEPALAEILPSPIAGVDIAMNTHLKTVKLLVKGKPAQSLESMSIRGSNIRLALVQKFLQFQRTAL